MSRTRTVERVFALLALVVYLAGAVAAWFGVVKLLPHSVHLTIAGKSFFMSDILERIIGGADQYIFAMMLLVPIFIIEAYMVGWKKCSIHELFVAPTMSGKTDLLFFVLSELHIMYFVGRIMVFLISLKVGMEIHDFIYTRTGVYISLGSIPLPLQFGIYFLLYTFLDYWKHRIDHSKYFWPLHRYHHAATDFTVLTSARDHPAAMSFVLFVYTPLAILNASPEVLVILGITMNALGFMWHCKIDSDLGWFGRWVVVSPVHHRLHHKLIDEGEPTKIFSAIVIWDRLFGTWEDEASQAIPIGVDTPYRHGMYVVQDIVRDWLDFLRGFVELGLRTVMAAVRVVNRILPSASGRLSPDARLAMSDRVSRIVSPAPPVRQSGGLVGRHDGAVSASMSTEAH